MEKYFLSRIQRENGVFSDGVEVHDTIDSALRSYWGRAKNAYGKNPAITFMQLKIKQGGNTLKKYDMTWKAENETENVFFLQHVRLDGEAFDKNIDPYESLDLAKADFASQMEYGYNNPKFPGVSFVSCMITDLFSNGIELMDETWEKQEEQPEPEPAE